MSADRTVRTVTLPDLGEGLTESDLVEWLVAVGDTVTLNQVVAEVETAKALVQLPSPWAGVVEALLVDPGTTVPVGGALLTIAVTDAVPSPSTAPGDAPPAAASGPDAPAPEAVADVAPAAPTGAPGDAAGPAPAAEPAEPAEPAVPERTSVLVGYGPLVEASARPHRRPRSAAWLAAHASANGTGRTHGTPPGAGRAAGAGAGAGTGPGAGAVAGDEHSTVAAPPRPTPPVRKLAHDLGVHLDRVQGTGPSGQITRDDVLHALVPTGTTPTHGTPSVSAAPVTAARPSSTATRPASAHATAPGDVRVPVTGVRRQTAAAMVASAFTAPHASVFLTVDVTPTTALLADLRADRAMDGHRVTLLALVAKAVTLAVRDHPDLNARWDEPAGEIVRHAHVGLGIAAATPRGLLVPVVHDADVLRLPQLADALRDLTEAARAGTTTPADLSGGTLTLTNVGVFGVDGGTPILVPGQSAIVAVGAVRRQPWEHDGAVALRDVLTLTVSFDHRVVDGEQASRFLADVGRVLGRPASVLAMV